MPRIQSRGGRPSWRTRMRDLPHSHWYRPRDWHGSRSGGRRALVGSGSRVQNPSSLRRWVHLQGRTRSRHKRPWLIGLTSVCGNRDFIRRPRGWQRLSRVGTSLAHWRRTRRSCRTRQSCVILREQSDNSCRSSPAGDGEGRRKDRRHSPGRLGNREQRPQWAAQWTDQRRQRRRRHGRCLDHHRQRWVRYRIDRSSGISCLVRLVAHGLPPPPGRGGADGPYRVHGRGVWSRACTSWLRQDLCRHGALRGIFITITATCGIMSERVHSPCGRRV